jgi:HEPN domain-containing protein
MSDAVEEFVKQWLIKAQEDWDVVQILTQNENPPASGVCFHCQQCVEKLIKAILTRHAIEFPKTHDIERLITLTGDLAPGLDSLTPLAKKLTVHGVDMRYPADIKAISSLEMKEVVEITEKFRETILSAL